MARERSRADGLMIGAFIALTILTVGQFIDSRLEDQQQRDDLVQVKEDLTTALDASTTQTRALIDQLRASGTDPVVDPSQVPDPDDVVKNGAPKPSQILPIPGPRGPGPTLEQVQAAVDTYCDRRDCKPAPTAAQVARALVAHCGQGACDGKDGRDGKDGSDGSDGVDGTDGAPGPQGEQGPRGETGPAPDPEQIRAAVSDYCGTGACAGTTTLSLSNCQEEAGMVITGIEPSGNPRDGYVLVCTKAADPITGGGAS